MECKFELSQRQKDHNGKSNLKFLEKIANLLLTSVKAIKVDKPNSQYRVRTTNLNGNLKIEKYLNTFTLFGTKYLDYKNWIKVLDYFKSGQYKYKHDIEEINLIKFCINDNRTILLGII
jgi:hypothetical protein